LIKKERKQASKMGANESKVITGSNQNYHRRYNHNHNKYDDDDDDDDDSSHFETCECEIPPLLKLFYRKKQPQSSSYFRKKNDPFGTPLPDTPQGQRQRQRQRQRRLEEARCEAQRGNYSFLDLETSRHLRSSKQNPHFSQNGHNHNNNIDNDNDIDDNGMESEDRSNFKVYEGKVSFFNLEFEIFLFRI